MKGTFDSVFPLLLGRIHLLNLPLSVFFFADKQRLFLQLGPNYSI